MKKCPKCKEYFDYHEFLKGPAPNSFYMCSICQKRFFYCENDKKLKDASKPKYDHCFELNDKE